MLNKKPVVLCIGSEKIAGDSLGPLVGDFLVNKYNCKSFIYGTTDNSVNGENLDLFLDFLSTTHKNCPIIAVDACLGKIASVGKIKISDGGVCPKKAVTGGGKQVGTAGVLGIVAESGGRALDKLMSVSVVNVEILADKIAFLLNKVLFLL